MTNFEKAEARIRFSSFRFRKLDLNNLSLSSEELSQLMPLILECRPFLEELDLSGNNLTEFVFNDVLRHLKKLDLRRNNLTVFQVTESLHILEELDLSDNNFSRVPYLLGDLKNVSYFDISNNNLKNLHGIENNRHLRVLKVKGNENLTQYNGFGALHDLERFEVVGNPMTLGTLLDLSEVRIDKIEGLTEVHQRLVNQMKENSAEVSIVESILKEHPTITIPEFMTLRQGLDENQVRGIVEFKLPLPELGVDIDLEGNLSADLHYKSTLSERFENLDEMKDFNQMRSVKECQEQTYIGNNEEGWNSLDAISQPESHSDISLNRNLGGGKLAEKLKKLYSSGKQVSPRNNAAPVISQPESNSDTNFGIKLPNTNFETDDNASNKESQCAKTISNVARMPSPNSMIEMTEPQPTKTAEIKKRSGSNSDSEDKKPAAIKKNLPLKKRKITYPYKREKRTI